MQKKRVFGKITAMIDKKDHDELDDRCYEWPIRPLIFICDRIPRSRYTKYVLKGVVTGLLVWGYILASAVADESATRAKLPAEDDRKNIPLEELAL